MFDERSFDTRSFDQRSWSFGTLVAEIVFGLNLYVFAPINSLYVRYNLAKLFVRKTP